MTISETEDWRVTRAQAAVLAQVSMRTISRWAALGLLDTQRPPSGSPKPATHSARCVLLVANRQRRVVTLELPEPDTSD